MYREPTSARETEELESCVLLTGSEAVSRCVCVDDNGHSE